MQLCQQGNFNTQIFPQSDLRCSADSHWTLPEISSVQVVLSS